MNILITGGAGFIGSNFIEYHLEKYPQINIINLDKLTYAGELSNLKAFKEDSRHVFVHGDICDRDLLETLFRTHKFNNVIHFAAESHVDNSISGPKDFIETNII